MEQQQSTAPHSVTVFGIWCWDSPADVGVDCTCGWSKVWEQGVSVPFDEMASEVARHIEAIPPVSPHGEA